LKFVATLPFASCAVNATPIGAPDAAEVGCVVTTSFVAVAAFAVAVNVTGDPVKPVALAVTVCVLAVGPSVHVVCANPLDSVVAVVVRIEPPPDATANVPATPATPTPSDALTLATSGCATGFPANPVWLFPDCAAIALGLSSTATVTVSAGPV